MLVSDFHYHLPPELIAQEALADRAASRMLVLHRAAQRWEDRGFRDLPEYIRPGDCLVLNNSRVLPARLFGRRGDRAVEILLARRLSPDGRAWQAMVRPGKKIKDGDEVTFDGGLRARVVARLERGTRRIEFLCDGDPLPMIEAIGHMPLPPYIKRADTEADRGRYQTMFARETGSVAAPTAGLHFTPEMLEACRGAGASVAEVTLHVGLGTFLPLEEAEVEANRLHTESLEVPAAASLAMASAKRVVAVGTTSVRAIESPAGAETNIFIYPGYEFRRTGAMLTNFHLPESSLLMLVAAFAGREFVLGAYRHAVEQGYRFFSYGDCMLVV